MNNNIYALSKKETKRLDRELKKVIKKHTKNRGRHPKRPIETLEQ